MSSPHCLVCGEDFAPDDARVTCCRCGTVHHRDCFAYTGVCATFGCGSTHRQEASPEAALVVLHLDVDDLPVPGRPTTAPDSSGALQVGGRTVSLAAPYVRLDSTRRIRVGPWLLPSLAAGAAAWYLLGWLPGLLYWPALGLLGLVGVALLLLALAASSFRSAYVLDNEARQIRYRRGLLGMHEEWRVADFDDVERVAVRPAGERGGLPCFRTVLELRSGEELRVSHRHREVAPLERDAEALARHLGGEFLPGPESLARALPGGDP